MPEPLQARSVATLEKIMVAAETVIAREGVGRLTMDGVAQEAGISKGGVLHHFRSKEALMAKLASRKLDTLRRDVERYVAQREGEPNKSLGGMVDHAATTYGCEDHFSRAMLMAAVENSQSLEQFRSMFAEKFRKVRDESGHPDAAAVLLFAVIGIQASHTLGIAELNQTQAKNIFDALRELALRLPVPGGGVE